MLETWQEGRLALNALLETNFPNLTLFARGKVRDIYTAGDNLLMVATDRISAFDHVLATGIPGKGKILNQLTVYWFGQLADIVPNHLISAMPLEYPDEAWQYREALKDRSMLVRKAHMFPVECVARGYLAGSGWKEYKETGKICGIEIRPGLWESDMLKEPIFTPATKSLHGKHDENITFDRMVELVGGDTAEKLRDVTLRLYMTAGNAAERKGILIADTKFEFGTLGWEMNPDFKKDSKPRPPVPSKIVLADEALTPDSSRFWDAEHYRPGKPQPSFDKQYVRDYLESIHWNKQAPAPPLPESVVKNTLKKYMDAFRLLTGRPPSL
ncbi:MAG TPA: phosphoribosylaminoimidazolesuccinocarboxamide synthase [Acidobacteriaceae bacterium]|nr:phosphoribosylaminoimidazolesuccinocarboxamide synthase [Acidobacteriaceae bacterium]